MPKSTTTTSPRLKLVIVHFRGGTKFFPGVRDEAVHRHFLLAPAFEEFQVVQDFTHHGFGLMLDFFNQNILRAHALNYPAKLVFGKPYCPGRPSQNDFRSEE